mmetsp:Transcript_21564/g.53215  ORF Transcript_21564/g.53215 Transcript_21564/m.53215 type:complete len:241 (+) Transcript_21564:206-928(+)
MTSSNRMQPTDQRSALASYPPLSRVRISGAMYSGEPTQVSARLSGARSRAKPKSPILRTASSMLCDESSRFPGFRSRCTQFRSRIARRPSASCLMRYRATPSSTGWCLRRLMACARSPPAQNSSTMMNHLGVFWWCRSRTMLAWLSDCRHAISLRSCCLCRCTYLGCCLSSFSQLTILIATSSRVSLFIPSYTFAKDPSPSGSFLEERWYTPPMSCVRRSPDAGGRGEAPGALPCCGDAI